MQWFKSLSPNHELYLEAIECVGKNGAFDIQVVVFNALTLGINQLNPLLISKWAGIKKDRAEKILPFAQKILSFTQKIYVTTQKISVTAQEILPTAQEISVTAQEILPTAQEISVTDLDFDTSNPSGSIKEERKSIEKEKEKEEIPPTPQKRTPKILMSHDYESNPMFCELWGKYPKKRRGDKSSNFNTFNALNPDEALFKKIIKGLEVAKGTNDWQKDDGQYVPLLSTFLNQRRWENFEDDESQDIEAVVIAKAKAKFDLIKANPVVWSVIRREYIETEPLVFEERYVTRGLGPARNPNNGCDYYLQELKLPEESPVPYERSDETPVY